MRFVNLNKMELGVTYYKDPNEIYRFSKQLFQKTGIFLYGGFTTIYFLLIASNNKYAITGGLDGITRIYNIKKD